MSGNVIFERNHPIARILISNPGKRNAMSLEMWHELAEAIQAANADKEIRTIIVMGAGDKAFVSGADISRFSQERSSASAADTYTAAIDRAVTSLTKAHKPIIAMINGACIGGGIDIAVCCDIRICAQSAQFSIPAARIGLGYATDVLRRVTNVVGFSAAKEMLITGHRISSERAYHINLVHRVVADDQLAQVVQEEAELIAANAPLSIRAAKWGITMLENGGAAEDVEEHRRLVALSNGSQDYTEGVRAFLEKRAPVFRGS